jgi:hypothetical protein
MDSRDTSNILGTRHKMKTNTTKNTTQKTRRIRNTDTTKNVGRTRVIGKGNQFLFLNRHPLCYSKSSKLKVLLVSES